jgi:ankyrin repeat protein
VQLLLNWGTDVNAQNWYYGSALQLALFSGSTELVGLLLRYGAKHNSADEQRVIYKNPYMGSPRRLTGILEGSSQRTGGRVKVIG